MTLFLLFLGVVLLVPRLPFAPVAPRDIDRSQVNVNTYARFGFSSSLLVSTQQVLTVVRSNPQTTLLCSLPFLFVFFLGGGVAEFYQSNEIRSRCHLFSGYFQVGSLENRYINYKQVELVSIFPPYTKYCDNTRWHAATSSSHFTLISVYILAARLLPLKPKTQHPLLLCSSFDKSFQKANPKLVN